MQTAIFAMGCFWCGEAIFQRLRGVESVTSGYTGGSSDNPNYQNIGNHAEAVKIEFDPIEISYEVLLEIFFHLHDPTQLNRQGADVGEQYRSEIFYTTDEQNKLAQMALETAQKDYQEEIVTKITKASDFFEAEDYHKNYYNSNQNAPYCKAVIDPKINNLLKKYGKYT